MTTSLLFIQILLKKENWFQVWLLWEIGYGGCIGLVAVLRQHPQKAYFKCLIILAPSFSVVGCFFTYKINSTMATINETSKKMAKMMKAQAGKCQTFISPLTQLQNPASPMFPRFKGMATSLHTPLPSTCLAESRTQLPAEAHHLLINCCNRPDSRSRRSPVDKGARYLDPKRKKKIF